MEKQEQVIVAANDNLKHYSHVITNGSELQYRAPS